MPRVTAQLKVKLDEKILMNKNYPVKNMQFDFIATGADKAGTVSMCMVLKNNKNNKELILKHSIERPDTSWLGNKHGLENMVPKPWSPMSVTGNKVSMWNRSYLFDGPFARQVISSNKELLAKPTELLINQKKVQFGKAKLIEQRHDYLLFEGVGQVDAITVKYRNKVWFDGFNRIKFSLGPKGAKVKSMQLKYTVKPEFAKYMSTAPLVNFKPKGNYFDLLGAFHAFSQLWLLGKKDGYCWIPENEGNWVYPVNTKPIKVLKDKIGANVELNIISKEVTLPEGVNYSFGFIATPTRPLPCDYRTTGFQSGKTAKYITTGWSGHGFTHYASLVPVPEYYKAAIKHRVGDLEKVKSMPYSSPTGLVDTEPVVKYFKPDWQLIGAPVFPIRHAHKENNKFIYYNQISLVRSKAFVDFFADKVYNFISRNDKYTAGLYYDLVFNFNSDNPVLYGAFTDAFGRKIPKQYTIIGLREALMRTLKICHSYNKLVALHDHDYYNPAAHGLADIW